jgi:pentatricopeptide repeat protein
MLSDGMKPNAYTLVGALSAASMLRSLDSGQYIHVAVLQNGFDGNLAVGNALINMYAKCGSWESSWNVFCKMHVKDVISWTSMLDAYNLHGRTKDTLQLFEEMQWEGMIPDKLTFLSILAACADLLAHEQGKKVHAAIVSRRFHVDEMVGTALIHMYGRCGDVGGAREVFDNIHKLNVHTWTAIITVYSQHGLSRMALFLFDQMLNEQVKPNELTFVSVLSACSHLGLMAEGFRHFDSISNVYGMSPTAEHYACIVDLLGRGGFLNEAEDFIEKMPIKVDMIVWRTMLSACTIFNNIERGKRSAENCIMVNPGYGAPYVVLSNIYALRGQWQEVTRVRKLMQENRAKKQPGRSSIEIKDKVHDFLVDDNAHPRIAEIRVELEKLYKIMEVEGCIVEANVVLHDVEEETDEFSMKHHSERLAIIFGHMMMLPNAPIRIRKNLRVCIDCHATIKHMSKILNREIFVRDSHYSHHFKDGICSCKDYW